MATHSSVLAWRISETGEPGGLPSMGSHRVGHKQHSSSSMYGCESWTVKKAERRRIDAFELWCWRRLLRVPWTARSKRLLISWLQSPSAVILEPKQIKSATLSTVSPSIRHEVMGLDALSFLSAEP